MLYPIMDPKRPPAERNLVAPPASGSAAVRFPAADELPPPYVDERLVEPETRQEMIHGRLIHAAPANAEHGDEHTVLDYVAKGTLAPGYIASTDLLTRAGSGSDFATDTCIRRSGIDPRTDSRYLEELAFEVVNTQSLGNMVERARMLSTCGVRRVFAVFVKKREVCEWSPSQDRFITLELDGAIEDRTLIGPLPVRALFDAAEADDSVARALMAKNNSVIAEVRAEGRAEGHAEGHAEGRAEGRAEGIVRGIEAVCALLGLPLGPRERARLDVLDQAGLETVLAHLEAERRWPDA